MIAIRYTRLRMHDARDLARSFGTTQRNLRAIPGLNSFRVVTQWSLIAYVSPPKKLTKLVLQIQLVK